MKHIAVLLITGSLLLLLTGCTAYKHNKAGDAAAATGDMRSAVYHYERALANKEKYARDADFLTKLAVARSRVAYDEAQRLRAQQGRLEAALSELRESMRQDPSFAEPGLLLPVVLKEAARWRYTQAVNAADHGDLAAAREHLSRSLQHDVTDEATAYAMASLTPEALQATTPGLAAYREGLSLSAERRWSQAEQVQLKVVAANGGLLPARAALYDAREQLAEARRLQSDGQSLIDQLTMGPAIKSLTNSLDIWPYNTQASDLLTKAKAQRALADEQFAKATKAAGQTRWDDAIALADSGLGIDRSHRALSELRSALPRRAAADYTHRGDSRLDKGELDEAHQSYTRALAYRETYREARLGMANVYSAWAKSHEQAGRLGAALLNYQKGQSYSRSKSLDEGVVQMRSAVRDRLDVGVSVSASERKRGAIDPKQLTGALLGYLQSKQSLGITIQGQGMPYELRLSIQDASVEERLTNTSRRTHHYTTEELCPNPEYRRVSNKLGHERNKLRGLERQLANFRCRGNHNGQPCDCFNQGRYNQLKRQVDRQCDVVNRLQRELSRTPRQITVISHHQWPYTVETYTKTGQLVVATELVETAGGKVIKRFTHQASFVQSDDRTLNANPGIGVRHDELNLYSDSYVADAIRDELASAAGPWAVNALVDHRLAQIIASIDLLEDKGKTDEALEARVDAAVLLAIVDNKASQAALDKLTQSHTR